MLTTCSRVEVYVIGPDADRLELELLGRLARRAGCPFEELANVLEVRHDADAARHLPRTAAGLESPVLGEAEILGQLRRAHRSAAAAGATGPALRQLVAHAVRAGRRVRTETGLATGPASLTSTVVVLARGLVGSPARRRALVIGRTRTACAAAERLLGDGWGVTTGSATLPPEPACPPSTSPSHAERLVTRLLDAPTARLRAAAVSGRGEQWPRRLASCSIGDADGLRAGRPPRPRATGAAR